MKAACPACGSPAKQGKPAFLVASGDIRREVVCLACHARVVPLVVLEDRRHTRAVLAPFAVHLRKLAAAYKLNDDARAEGLLQAADILDEGRAVDVAAVFDLPPGFQSPAEARLAPKAKPQPKPAGKPANGSGSAGWLVDAAKFAATLTSYQRALLRVLKQHGRVNRAQLALIAGYSPNSGSFTEALALLRSQGLLDGLALTPAGQAAAGSVEPLPTGQGLVRYWCERVGAYAGTLLQVIVTAYPESLTREELADRAGYHTSGSFTEAIAKLRKLDLITARGLRASEALMGGVRLVERSLS